MCGGAGRRRRGCNAGREDRRQPRVSENVFLAAALKYAKRGWLVFPCYGIDQATHACLCGVPDCASKAKHPMTPNGLDAATLDPKIIRSWWEKNPNANVAIRTGAESGILVLDYDG